MLQRISTPILVAVILYHSYHYYQQVLLEQKVNRYAEEQKINSQQQKQHAPPTQKQQIVKVTDKIYVATGYTLGNSIMVIGDTGVVIIDTTESAHKAKIIAKEFRNFTDKPVVGIIYTHNHADHVLGTEAFLEYSTNRSEVEIWGHHTLIQTYFLSTGMLGITHFYRGMHQFGVFLPNGVVSAGIGSRLELGEVKFVPPNKLLYKNQQTIKLAGLELTLMHVPGETDDQICVYWQKENALLGTDNLYKAFPNLYAIRGTHFRSLKVWYESLDKMRALRPDYFVMSHHYPLIGKDVVYQTMTNYRDAVQLVHDQTVRFINQGLHPDEIAERIKLPEKLLNHPYLQELYGTVRWSSKGLFSGYMGWFSGDINELDPLSPSEKAERLVELAGGLERVLVAADKSLNENDAQWALHLSSAAVRVAPFNSKAKEMKAKALFDMAERQTSFNGYNYYKTAAYITLGTVQINPPRDNLFAQVKQTKINDLFTLMSLKFMSEKCGTYSKVIKFVFPDIRKTIEFQVRNGIMDMSGVFEEEDEARRTEDFKVTVDSMMWKSILTAERSLSMATVSSNGVDESDVSRLQEFILCFDRV